MRGRRREQGGLESLLISIAVHLAVILLVPFVEQPVLDVYPLDIAGVIEIATIEAAPAAPAPAPGVAVQEVTPKPKPAAPEPAKEQPKPTPAPAPKPEPAVQEQPKQEAPAKQDKPDVVTSPAATMPSPIVAAEPPEATPPEAEPKPERAPTPEPAPTPAAEPEAAKADKTTSSPGPGRPDGVGTIPRPDYPGDDPTGMSMITTTGGDDHGVWIPKGVQNLRGRGEALVRIKVKADATIDAISFLEPPPDPAMTQAIQSAISGAWRFGKDSTPGRADAYYLDVRVGYDGGTMDVWVKSERASYIR